MPPDALGLDGTVRLRCYLPLHESIYFGGGCPRCARSVAISVQAAVKLMGSAEATVGQLAHRLICRGCHRRVSLQVMSDSRTPEVRRQEGRLPQTMGLVVTDANGNEAH